MKLSDRQATFTIKVARLLIAINDGQFDTHERRLRARLRDVYRDPRAFGYYGSNDTKNGRAPYGSARSEHKRGLAADILIDIWDVEKQTWVWAQTCEAYQEIGKAWEKDGGTWGGVWSNGDCNHFQE